MPIPNEYSEFSDIRTWRTALHQTNNISYQDFALQPKFVDVEDSLIGDGDCSSLFCNASKKFHRKLLDLANIQESV